MVPSSAHCMGNSIGTCLPPQLKTKANYPP
uniref:Uncharacterized protein n=1 Tax=Arundo donax TaxID=35708 RepID=A0A0A9F377_ARUDO